MLREMLGIAEGILQDLHDDHQEVSALIDRIVDCKEPHERTSLFNEMMTKLLAHAHAEQQVLYRRLERSEAPEARSLALEGENEHQHVEEQLKQLKQAGAQGGEHWAAQMIVLRDLVDHHVKKEESTGFSCARDEFDRGELDRMAEEFRREKQRLMTEA